MRAPYVAAVGVVLVVLGCERATAPVTSLVLTRAADLAGVVMSTTYESGWVPAGFYMRQYDIWVAVRPDTSANAGVVVSVLVPVFVREYGALYRASASVLAVGDSLQIWTDSSVTYGAVEAPPGAPCYFATQVLDFPAW
jgi:hypothetical protein